MAPEAFHKDRSVDVRLGNRGRMLPETRELTLLILGHLFVFLLSMGHDEIVALTLRLVSILQRAKSGADAGAASDDRY